MYFDYSQKSAILLIFFVHGLVFSVLLVVKGIRNNDKPALWLSFFTFLCTLYISPFMLGYAGWYGREPYRNILFYLPLQQIWLMPPVFYFYCKALFDKSFTFTSADRWHFLPALLYLAYAAFIFVADNILLGYPFYYADGKDKDFSLWYQLCGFGLSIIYLIKSLKLYRKFRQLTYNTSSIADTVTFKWAQMFLILLLLLVVCRGAFFLLNPEWAGFGRKFWYYLSFSILFYCISISGYTNSVRSVVSLNQWFYEPIAGTEEQPTKVAEVLTDKTDLTELSTLRQGNTLADLEAWKTKLSSLMEKEKLYENAELSIWEVAQLLDTHSRQVSQIINQGFGMNFNDFVNRYRVEAVIRKMEAGEHNLQTLLGIAYDCGFNSKSTFNRSFKRHTGLSPNEFVQNRLKN